LSYQIMDPIIVPMIGAGMACGIIGGSQAVENWGHSNGYYGTRTDKRGHRHQYDLSGREYNVTPQANSRGSRDFSAQEPYASTNEPYVSANEAYISANEPYGHRIDERGRRIESRSRRVYDRRYTGGGAGTYDTPMRENFREEMLEREGFRPSSRPSTEDSKLFPPRLGLFLSANSPFVVERIYTLMDPEGWKHWEARYGNPELRVGDTLVCINGVRVQGLDLPLVNAKLGSQAYSVRTLTFHRGFDTSFQVKLVRHVDGKRPPWTRPKASTPVAVADQCISHRQDARPPRIYSERVLHNTHSHYE